MHGTFIVTVLVEIAATRTGPAKPATSTKPWLIRSSLVASSKVSVVERRSYITVNIDQIPIKLKLDTASILFTDNRCPPSSPTSNVYVACNEHKWRHPPATWLTGVHSVLPRRLHSAYMLLQPEWPPPTSSRLDQTSRAHNEDNLQPREVTWNSDRLGSRPHHAVLVAVLRWPWEMYDSNLNPVFRLKHACSTPPYRKLIL